MDGSVASRRIYPPRSGIAERIWEAARTEFSKRGYHGARVQGIARGAACNVALMYRHWASKRALYVDILRAVWVGSANEIARLLEEGTVGPDAVVIAYVDAMMADPLGAQILIREYLDGAPFLAQLAASDPSIVEPLRRAASALAGGGSPGLDPMLAVVTVGGVAALVAATREAARPFAGEPLEPEGWRRHVLDLLVHGLSPRHGPTGPHANGSAGGNGAVVP
ncbi:MAG TPA: TetR/AcrR family transcriptional regulator [Anaeromyxobacter sp.]